MTFYPDGQPKIPNQTPIPGQATFPGPQSPYAVQADAVLQWRQRNGRRLLRAGAINTVILVIAVWFAFIQPVTDDSAQAFLIVVIAGVAASVHLILVSARSRREHPGLGLAAPPAPTSSATYGAVSMDTPGTAGLPLPVPPGRPSPQVMAAIASGVNLPSAVPPGAPTPGPLTVPPGVPMQGVPPQVVPTDSATLTGFMMEVTDVFTITGRGTVATGRVAAGAVDVGQRVAVVRGEEVVAAGTVSGIEAFRRQLQTATAGQVIGLQFSDLSRSDVVRGDQLHG